MKNNRLLYFIGFVLFLSILIYNFVGLQQSNAEVYIQEIQDKRIEKNTYFKTSKDSPITDKNKFKALPYFEIQEKYKVEAQIERIKNPEIISVTMSKGNAENYLKFAYAIFVWEDKTYRLLLLRRNMQEPFLFLAFTDATTGKQTYGGGRYLDMPYTKDTKKIFLDFNLAYHPYCVYNYNYVCPLPPKENHLTFAVLAGEKLD